MAAFQTKLARSWTSKNVFLVLLQQIQSVHLGRTCMTYSYVPELNAVSYAWTFTLHIIIPFVRCTLCPQFLSSVPYLLLPPHTLFFTHTNTHMHTRPCTHALSHQPTFPATKTPARCSIFKISRLRLVGVFGLLLRRRRQPAPPLDSPPPFTHSPARRMWGSVDESACERECACPCVWESGREWALRRRVWMCEPLRECESKMAGERESGRMREWVRGCAFQKRFRFSFYFFSRDSSPVWRRGSKGPWRTLELGVIAALFHRSPPPLLLLWGCTSATTTSSSSSSPRLDPTKYLESTLFPLLISFSVLCQEVSHCPQQHTSDIKNYLDIVQRYQESV